MENKTKNLLQKRKTTYLTVLLVVIVLAGIATLALNYYFQDYISPEAQCVAAGGKWEERMCIFERPVISETPEPEPAEETPIVSTYKDLITLSEPKPNAIVASPLTVRGMARGPWFFEASFPLIITDWDGRIIGEGYAQADEEWMTTEYVPFTGTLTFTVPPDTAYRRGTLILKKENPSGLPERDDAFEIPVNF